jgi:hypothetical protein
VGWSGGRKGVDKLKTVVNDNLEKPKHIFLESIAQGARAHGITQFVSVLPHVVEWRLAPFGILGGRNRAT